MIDTWGLLIQRFHAVSSVDAAMLLTNGGFAFCNFVMVAFCRSYALSDVRRSKAVLFIRFGIAANYLILCVRIGLGWYWTPMDPSELIINAFIFGALVFVRGDIPLAVELLGKVPRLRALRHQTGEAA